MSKDIDNAALLCKEEGNAAYKAGDLDTALSKYTEGLKLSTDSKNTFILLKNRSAVHLKAKNFEKVIEDSTKALEITPNDPKALYRRAQAYDELSEYEKAYADVRLVQKLDPKNKEVLVLLEKLHVFVQAKVEKSSQLSSKASRLYEILADVNFDKEKRETSANNLVALAKESAGATLLMKDNVYSKISEWMPFEKNQEVKLGLTRTLSELFKNLANAKKALKDIGLPKLLDMMNSVDQLQVNAAQYTFHVLISTLSGSTMKDKKVDKVLLEENRMELDSIMYTLTCSITNRTMTPICRDAAIEIICKNLDYKVLNWAKKFVKADGLTKLLEVASEVPEYRYESSIETTDNTRMIIAICLLKIYEAHDDDKSKAKFMDIIDENIKEKLLRPDVESKVCVGVIITTLLLGPIDAGNAVIAREGILNMFLAMAKSDDPLQQRVACETLIAAASKKDKCQAIMSDGTNILKELYQSPNDSIKVRALVGLCKLGSLGGTDASLKPFAEGASLKLAEACRRFLLNRSQNKEMQRWACEGLSYLTLDGEVKEKLVEDRPALRAIIELAKTGDKNCLYGVVTTLVNLCNAYDQQEIIPEMVELAKFAKQHIPEEHELDDKDFVDKRVNALADEGIASALLVLSKTESQNSRELIARVFNAICEHTENRGKVVAQGGTKTLLNLFAEGTPKGKKCAAQALARIAITMDPGVAFPGQRAYEVVKPLIKLLDVDGDALENFEALMALCNIAGISESTRQRIIKEGGLSLIEHYTFEHHDLIRRAAIQCTANMCTSPDVVKILEGNNDRFKYLFLCCSDEDEEIIKAAGGAICMMLGDSKKLCEKIFKVNDWEDTLKFLLSHGKPDIQYRGTVIVYLLVETSKEYASRIIQTHCKDALMAISQIFNPEIVIPKAREYAEKTLQICRDHKLIVTPSDDD